MVQCFSKLVMQSQKRQESIFKQRVSIGCSTEILRDKLQEGCYNVEWLDSAL